MMASGDLRAYLRSLAHRVWTDQGDALKHGLTLQEETVTEMLLLQMARDLSPLGLNVKMFTRTEEGGRKLKDGTVEKVGNGADWEWFVDLPDCMVGFRVQAKRLFGTPAKNGSYDGFTPGGAQINDLIIASGELNPVYVFYNHGYVRNAKLFKRSSKTNWFGGSAWGCSVATARFMRSLKKKSLEAVYPGMIPWHRFFVVGNTGYRGCPVERMMTNMEGGQQFRLATSRPAWVAQLLEMDRTSDQSGIGDVIEVPDDFSDNPSPLDRILRERNLRGVAYFDFTDFQEN